MSIKAGRKGSVVKACCLSGLTPIDLPFGFDEESLEAAALFNVLHQEIENQIQTGCFYFISGMNWGIELIGAEMVMKLRTKYPSVKLICVIPFEEQAAKWNEENRNRYFEVLEHADEMKLICMRYSEDSYDLRDDYILQKSNRIIAVIDEEKEGGKALTEKAIRQGLETILISPRKMGVKHVPGHRNFKLI